MSVLTYYSDRMEPLKLFDGTTEMALVLRRGKTMSPQTIVDGKIILTELDTKIKGGDLVERSNDERYFIVAKQFSSDCVQMQGRRINASVKLSEITDRYINHRKMGSEIVEKDKDIPVYFKDVSAQMHKYDAGLLAKTVKKFIFHNTVPIKILDRVTLNGINYQVDNIDTAKYIGLYEVQVSEDTRE